MSPVSTPTKPKRLYRKASLTRAVKKTEPPPLDLTAAIVIEDVKPQIDGGLYPVKSIVGQAITVQATIYRDGCQILAACVKFKEASQSAWQEVPLGPLGDDQWQATFIPTKNARYVYTIEAWSDLMATWLDRTEKKGRCDLAIKSEAEEGLHLLTELQEKLEKEDRQQLAKWSKRLSRSEGISEEVLRIIHDPEFLRLVKQVPLKSETSSYRNLELVVDRKRAEYGSWYEMFPRSQVTITGKSGTIRDCIRRLPDIKRMGFNVVYLPPIHPIGMTHRKGKNNALTADKTSPGSPWAIGNEEGGHKSIHPELGTMEDFDDFVEAANDFGIEIALDYALHCSADHPYVKLHPNWFYSLPDGSIKYAEDPPQKYLDIYPFNFNCGDREALWIELKRILEFWVAKGIRIFHVSNPHIKPLRFWQWVISEIQRDHPEVIFLAEAFTDPHRMKFLAKAGFTQSYTYFIWRTHKWELRDYLTELVGTNMRDYFRGNFFVNTPDILHEYLQRGGPNAFKIRLILAGTLSSSYGIHSGYELCENTPRQEASEEYLDSEKYQYKVRNWNRSGNIKDFIAIFNGVRARQPALQQYRNLKFYHTLNDDILAYGKWTPDMSNIIVTVVNLDPFHVHEDLLHFPFLDFGLQFWQTYQMIDLLTGAKYDWRGERQYIRLDPYHQPAHIFLLRK